MRKYINKKIEHDPSILQLLEMTLPSVGNISQSLQLDPYFFLQKYVPYVDVD